MVAHEGQPAAAKIEAAHPVGPVGHGKAVVHRVAEAREDSVGKAERQIEQACGIGDERAVSLGERGRSERCTLSHAAGGGARGYGAAGSGEEAAAIVHEFGYYDSRLTFHRAKASLSRQR